MAFEADKSTRAFHTQINNAAYSSYNAVLSGCEVLSTSGMDVEIDAGSVLFQTIETAVTTDTLTLSPGHASYPRIDLIVFNGTGLEVLEGIPEGYPYPPNYAPEDYVVLHQVYVEANETTLVTGDITDYRVLSVASAGATLVDDSTIEYNISSELQVKNLGITEAKLAANAVTTGKIANGAILNEDINTSAAIAESKLAFDIIAGHNHNGVNSKAVNVPTEGTSFPATATILGQHYIYTEFPIKLNVTASYTNYTATTTKEATPTGIDVSPDGTHFYIIGSTSDSVHEYSISPAYSGTITFVRTLSIAAKETVPTGIRFKPDGTEFYIVGTSSDSVHQYTMSTPWNISTATFTRSFSIAQNIKSIVFANNGGYMYIENTVTNNTVRYTLTTPWDISTAGSAVNYNLSNPYGMFVSNDGTKLYLGYDSGSGYIYEYDVTTPYDLSTARLINSDYVTGDTIKGLMVTTGNGTTGYIYFIAEALNYTRVKTTPVAKNALIAVGTTSGADWKRITS